MLVSMIFRFSPYASVIVATGSPSVVQLFLHREDAHIHNFNALYVIVELRHE